MSKIYVDEIAGIASADTVAIPGHVIQTVNVEGTTQTTISTGYPTFSTIISGSITPKVSGSKFVITAVLPNYSSNGNANAWTNSIYIRMYEQEGSASETVAAGYEHPGPQPSQEFSQVIPVLFTSGVKTTVQQYTYTIKGSPTVAGDSHYFGRITGEYGAFPRMTIQEIAG